LKLGMAFIEGLRLVLARRFDIVGRGSLKDGGVNRA
jgi:hypothetical protein